MHKLITKIQESYASPLRPSVAKADLGKILSEVPSSVPEWNAFKLATVVRLWTMLSSIIFLAVSSKCLFGSCFPTFLISNSSAVILCSASRPFLYSLANFSVLGHEFLVILGAFRGASQLQEL
ncbi:hypothetical protein L596_009626 [Steinernema carpocapsae]|uniref:Uncharacterized protein n=1 Tax=Steinernema carpocapsae TaxID=34508 RepID=A0A4U5PG72_STECR|nr:hypothetical protein L596_009626 [Steinernema carpocapsae]